MKVLIVDDDPDIVEVVTLCFEMRWPDATIITAPDGGTGIETFQKQGADLIILDLGLPDMDGLEVLQRIRTTSKVFVIILTVRNQQKDVVRGLELGADDYITKPFDQMELLARAQSILRRGSMPTEEKSISFNDGELHLDFSAREVTLGGEAIKLTPTEYKLLYHLATNPGKPMTHKDLLVKVWGQEYLNALEYLKVHIQHLRQKLNDDSNTPRFISTERGIGYKFIGKQ